MIFYLKNGEQVNLPEATGADYIGGWFLVFDKDNMDLGRFDAQDVSYYLVGTAEEVSE